MSCRVLKRGVEYLAFDAVYRTAVEWGSERIVGEYLPTKKNGMVKDFYSDLGFQKRVDGKYELNTTDYRKMEYHINT